MSPSVRSSAPSAPASVTARLLDGRAGPPRYASITAWSSPDLVRLAVGDHPALGHHDHPVGVVHHHLHVVLDEQEGDSLLTAQALHVVEQPASEGLAATVMVAGGPTTVTFTLRTTSLPVPEETPAALESTMAVIVATPGVAPGAASGSQRRMVPARVEVPRSIDSIESWVRAESG